LTINRLIKERVHPEDMAIILGKHPVALRRLLPRGYRPLPRMTRPYGLTDATDPLRAQLGGIIALMSESGLSRDTIAEITGLNKRESYKAERRPFAFDWKLSQIERTLDWYDRNNGTTSTEILVRDATVETQPDTVD
jgi:hypothetical protein